MKRKYLRALVLVIAFFLTVISIYVGPLDVSLQGILNKDHQMLHTLLYSRIPRTLSVILSAASLGISGLIMQKISSNRFVSPQTAITQDATKFGVLISLLLNFNNTMRILFSILIAFISSLGFFKLIKKIKVTDPMLMPLLGIILGSMIEAFTSLIAQRYDMVQPLNGIFSKGFTSIFSGGYEILFINCISIIVAYVYFKKFVIISLNDSTAKNLGIDTKTVINIGLLLISIMTTLVSLSVGNIPFVGLLIPNLVSLMFDDSSQGLFLDTLLYSVCYLLLCDIVSRTLIYPYELPVSLISGVLGASIFIIVLIRGKYEKK